MWDTIHDIVELHQLVQFDKECFPSQEFVTIKEYMEWFDAGLKVHILKEYDSWIGTYQIIHGTDDINYFAGFTVHPDYRGQGKSVEIMNHMLDNYNDCKLKCKTLINNHAMKRVLGSHGFTQTDIEIEGINTWTWWTKISKQEQSLLTI